MQKKIMENDIQLLDARLSDEGVNQCHRVSDLLNQVKLHHIVWVSPMRRAIETACLSLASHPQRD